MLSNLQPFCTVWAMHARYLLGVIHINRIKNVWCLAHSCRHLATTIVIIYKHWILKYSQWSQSKIVFLEYAPPPNAQYYTTRYKTDPQKGPPASPLTRHSSVHRLLAHLILLHVPAEGIMYFLRVFCCLSRYIFLLFHCNSSTHFTSLAILKHEN